jgi:hypothetical protein
MIQMSFLSRRVVFSSSNLMERRNAMQPTRRQMIVTVTGAVVATFTARPVLANGLAGQQRPSPQPLPSPNAPTNTNAPVGLDGSDIPVTSGGRQLPPATWAEVKSDAQKILDLATDFKWQVDRANLNATLPLLLIQEAHSLEKLAKQVGERMKR